MPDLLAARLTGFVGISKIDVKPIKRLEKVRIAYYDMPSNQIIKGNKMSRANALELALNNLTATP